MLYEDKVSPEFAAKVVAICARLGFNPDWLMAAIGFETAHTFSPYIKNPHSGAVGLIQFTPPAADAIGASMQDLGAMDAITQLDWVEKYMALQIKRAKKPLATISDVYMAIFYPVGIKYDLDQILPKWVGNSNPIFVNPATGQVTKRFINTVIYSSLPKDYRPFNYAVDPSGAQIIEESNVPDEGFQIPNDNDAAAPANNTTTVIIIAVSATVIALIFIVILLLSKKK